MLRISRHNKNNIILTRLIKIRQNHILHILRIITISTVLSTIVQAREADKRSYFLYTEDQCKDPCPVHDYQLHIAAPEDEIEEEQVEAEEQKEEEVQFLENAKPDKPFFLQPRNSPRIVEFYSPWCGHCQNFRSRYIELAREVQHRSPTNELIEFYAVSCSAYHWVCQEHKITGYPTILAYPSGSTVGIPLTRFTPKVIATAVNVKLLEGGDHSKDNAKSQIEMAEAKPIVDILGASVDVYRRIKKQTFSDAALSFTHALRHDIYKETNDIAPQSLTSTEAFSFSEWIDLLFWTLPPTWRIHALINDLRVDMENAVSDKSLLIQMVNHEEEVVNEHATSSDTWSPACSYGQPKVGYTCGLWNLFHIVSVGVVERHQAVLGARDRATVSHSATTLRNYIQNFLGTSCSYCRESFINVFDNCGLNSCKRFNPKKKYSNNNIHWQELALWLWEFHNEINILKLKDKMKKVGKETTLENIDEVIWPSKEACPKCYLEKRKEKWNFEEVYAHLKNEYWPGGVQNFRYVVLETKSNQDNNSGSGLFSVLIRLCIATLTLFSIMIFIKRIRLFWTGRHKKYDHRFQ